MSDFNSVLHEALLLAPEEQAKLINALWNATPDDADTPLHADWALELEHRVAEINSGAATTIPWQQIRDEALARLNNGSQH